LWSDQALRFAILFFALITFVTSMQHPLVVVFIKDVIGASDKGLGFLIAMAGVGGMIGSGLAVLSRRWISAIRLIPLVTLLDGAALIFFALATSLTPAMIFFAVFGVLGGALQVRVISLFQTRVPEESRGRAFGWMGPIFGPLGVASIALGTFLADRVGVVPVIFGSGVLEGVVALVAVLWLLGKPGLARITDREESSTGPAATEMSEQPG
jgi:MFS family permease